MRRIGQQGQAAGPEPAHDLDHHKGQGHRPFQPGAVPTCGGLGREFGAGITAPAFNRQYPDEWSVSKGLALHLAQ